MLILAESAARAGNAELAASTLNSLLVKRWKTGTYTPYDPSIGANALLAAAISERRKELVLRSGLRWSDLRRYGNVTPQRNLNGKAFSLPPGDPRYAFLLPLSVVQLSGIEQNKR
ncbi:unnamed protein product [Sphagnum tenellum]